jgi:hypothetical protein
VAAATLVGAAATVAASCSLSEKLDAHEYRAARGAADPIDAPDPFGDVVGFAALEVGDCVSFDSDTGEEVTGLLVVGCSQLHTHEVTLNEPIKPFGNKFPGETVIDSFAWSRCDRAFRAYVGDRAARDPDLSVVWFAPDERLWRGRDRTLQCLVESKTMISSTLRA